VLTALSLGVFAFTSWQLAKVRGQLALALASLATSRLDIDSLKGQLAVLLARWSAVQDSWDEDRARLVSSNHDLMQSNRNAFDVIRATLSRSDVPASLAGEWLASVLAQGPSGSTAPRAATSDRAGTLSRDPATKPPAGDSK
jgi:hypothetical protein